MENQEDNLTNDGSVVQPDSNINIEQPQPQLQVEPNPAILEASSNQSNPDLQTDQPSRNRKSPKLFIIILALIIILGGCGYAAYARYSSNNKTENSPNDNKSAVENQSANKKIEISTQVMPVVLKKGKNLWLTDTDGAQAKQITTTGSEAFYISSASVSPDGQYFAYAESTIMPANPDDRKIVVHIYNIKQAKDINTGINTLNTNQPTWSKDNRLSFYSYGTANQTVYILAADGTIIKQINQDLSTSINSMIWAKNDLYYYNIMSGSVNIYQSKSGTENFVKLTSLSHSGTGTYGGISAKDDNSMILQVTDGSSNILGYDELNLASLKTSSYGNFDDPQSSDEISPNFEYILQCRAQKYAGRDPIGLTPEQKIEQENSIVCKLKSFDGKIDSTLPKYISAAWLPDSQRFVLQTDSGLVLSDINLSTKSLSADFHDLPAM